MVSQVAEMALASRPDMHDNLVPITRFAGQADVLGYQHGTGIVLLEWSCRMVG